MVARPAWRYVAAWAVGLVIVVTGCASAGDPSSSSDCASQIRADGVVYTSHGFTDRGGAEHGSAERASCDDVGEDAQGSVFDGDSGRVTTWTIEGYSPSDVLGVRFDTDSFEVFVSDAVSPRERDRIYEDLGRSRR
jgi:hypothetical protein